MIQTVPLFLVLDTHLIDLLKALSAGEKLTRYLVRANAKWSITTGLQIEIAASLEIPADTAWKLFAKAIQPDEARRNVTM